MSSISTVPTEPIVSTDVPIAGGSTEKPSSSVHQMKKTHEKAARKVKTPTLKDLIDTAFQQEVEIFHESGQQLKVGDAVAAKMKGFSPWPGRILHFSSNNKMVNVYFYGTHNTGPVGSKNIVPFPLARETIRLVCLRSPGGFIKGVKELENEHQIPDELSCLVELQPIK